MGGVNLKLTVGVLALQGAFYKHIEVLRAIGVQAVEVRTAATLSICDALIIPGGESTTMMKVLEFTDSLEQLKTFALQKPIFGTCAGIILMSKTILNDQMKPFDLMNITVERNAFGRQVESFNTTLEAELNNSSSSVEALFIRAPRIRQCGPEVKVLASYKGEPVLVQQGKYLGATFHPELTNDFSIHRHFISIVQDHKRQ